MSKFSKEFEVTPEDPKHDEGKLNRLLEGAFSVFPGNGMLSQFFSTGFENGRIDSSKIALIQDEKSVTFAQLEEISDKIAAIIRETVKNTRNQNPDGDSVIAICIPPSLKLMYVMFAIHKLGAAYLPIEPSFPEDRVFKIVKDCRPLLIVSDHHSNILSKFDIVKELSKVISTQEIMNQVNGKSSQAESQAVTNANDQAEGSEDQAKVGSSVDQAISGSNSVGKGQVEVLAGVENLAERTAIILYTSGSSGDPKGVRLSHRTVLNRLSWQWNVFPFTKDEICVLKTSLTFVDSVPEIFGPLLQGYPLVIFDKHITSQPTIFIERLSFYKITRVTVVPSLLKAILQTINMPLSTIGTVGVNLLRGVSLWICSGEPFGYDLLSEFFDVFPRKHTIANFYGSTEMMGDVTYIAYSSREEAYKKALDKKVPIGIPVFNTVVYVLDKDMNMSTMNEIGEIYVAGYNLATNYVGGSNAEKFVENPYTRSLAFKTLYRTGDYGMVSHTQDGGRMLFYEGRIDSQIKVRGQRVDLAEVELALSEIHLISKVVVLCYRPGEPDQTVLAYVVPTEPDVSLERLEPMIEKRLMDYQRPLIKFIEGIPLLVNGKTDRQRLLKMYETELLNREEFEEWSVLDLPADRVETGERVLKVMSRVTGTSVETLAANIDNSFFNVGGTSLNAVVVVVKMRAEKLFISVGDFANAKTIRHIILGCNQMSESNEGEEQENKEEQEFGGESNNPVAPASSTSNKYVITSLTEADKEEAVNTISYSFAKKGDLEAYTKATYQEFQTLINSIWDELVEKGFSFVVRRIKDQKCVGVAFNFDTYDEPDKMEMSKAIGYSLHLLEVIESRQKLKLPKGRGKLLHSFMMGTPDDVDDAESVAVIETMEDYILKLAAEKKFMGVMTCNTNPLTKQIGLDIHGYEVLTEYKVNKYTAPDGTKPFVLAPDSFTLVCCWKQIPGNQMDMF